MSANRRENCLFLYPEEEKHEESWKERKVARREKKFRSLDVRLNPHSTPNEESLGNGEVGGAYIRPTANSIQWWGLLQRTEIIGDSEMCVYVSTDCVEWPVGRPEGSSVFVNKQNYIEVDQRQSKRERAPVWFKAANVPGFCSNACFQTFCYAKQRSKH